MRYVEASKIHEVIAEKQKGSGLNVKDFAAAHNLQRTAMSNVINGNMPAPRKLLDSLGIELVYRVP